MALTQAKRISKPAAREDGDGPSVPLGSFGLGFETTPSSRQNTKKIALIGNKVDTLIRFRGPLIREIAAHGHTVFALVPGFTSKTREEVRQLGAVPVEIPLHRTSLSPWRYADEVLRLRGVLRALQPDVVLTYFLRPIIVGSLAARLAKVPRRFCLIEGAGYLYTEQEVEIFRRRALRSIVTRLFRTMLAGSDGVFVLNRDDQELVVGSRIMNADKVICLPGIGIDLDYFYPAPPVHSPPTFLLAARLIPEKGISDYVAAARRVKAQRPDARFVLVGSADEHPSRIGEEQARRWVAEGLIEWPGHIEDIRPYMGSASVYTLPSFYREGLPRSLLEALAMARPIITTDATGCRDAVIEGENGYLVPRRDPAALAEAMIRFVREPQLITTMGHASRRLAETRFDVHRVNATFLRAMGLGDEPSRPPNSDAAVLREIRPEQSLRPPHAIGRRSIS